jgi:hypothetical protein
MKWYKCVTKTNICWYFLWDCWKFDLLYWSTFKIYNITWNCIFLNKSSKMVSNATNFTKYYEKNHTKGGTSVQKKQGHKLVFFAWQKDRPQNELLWENHHVKLHDYFGWGVFWDKTWKVIVGNDIIVRNNKHVELSGNQSAITKVWLKKNMNFLKNWRIACF